MKEQSQTKSGDEFLKTDGGKTKTNSIEVPSISLPNGGGAIKGIDEKFSVNAVNGTSSFSIPLPVSSARNVTPNLGISYSSGSGNGIFGLGWDLSLGSIKRKTDQELPQYLDGIESDVYLLSDAEELVPEFKKKTDGSFQLKNGDYLINERNSPDGLFVIRNYRPRIEGLFARIERWIEKSTGRIKWRVINKDNGTTLFGWTDNAVIADPDDQSKICNWLPEFVFDDKGNCSQYVYKKEDEQGIDQSLIHNRNRLKNGLITYTNLYPDKVLYGNKTPYKNFGDAFPPETDYMFQTVFDYGTTDTINQPFDKINSWDFRPDAFSNYKNGFEIRTSRLCKRVLLFHVFSELALRQDKSDSKTLIKSLNFEYNTTIEQNFTFLTKVTSFGYIKKPDGSFSHKKLPALEFNYQNLDWNKEVKTILPSEVIHAPIGLDESLFQFVDLFNEGLPGILTEQARSWYYKQNLGDGKFEAAKVVALKPSFAGLNKQLQFADLDADGGKQLVSFGNEPKGYFELNDANEWHGLQTFKTLPNIDFGASNIRLLDLNGDGKPDVVISDEQVFTWYASQGRNGYSDARKTKKSFDEEKGPNIVFADATQTIYLADMSGDGLTDIVRIRNGEVCFWPNLGYGKFGAKVAMDNAPVFDNENSFNPSYLKLADIDGSGAADIIYLGKNKFTCWKNLSGNHFSKTPFEIDAFPDVHAQSNVTVADLLGNGLSCIVWSSSLPKDANAPLKYIDLMNSKKPHIMVNYLNNLGKEVSIEYKPSTKFYIEDKLAGKPWKTKLHFPVHCISKTTTEDKISGYKFVSEYKYHHGYFDHSEREFRGFGMVEKIDSETYEHWVKSGASNITEKDLHQDPVITKSWNHTGALLQKDKLLNQFEDDYWYREIKRKLNINVVHNEKSLPDAKIILAPGIDQSVLSNLSAQEWREAFRACKGMALRSEIFAYDAEKFENEQDALEKELIPFTVSTHNCIIEMLQPKGKNKNAIFIVKESEAISYGYERNVDDPRISHTLNIKLDEYGNVLESASVVYPRLLPDTSLPLVTQKDQDKTIIIFTQNQFTNDVFDENVNRVRLPSETKTYELKKVPKAEMYFAPEEFKDILLDTKTTALFYHEIDKPAGSKAQKRLIEHVRSVYYKNNLTDPLLLHHLESLAIPFESYQLAYTPELVFDIFESRVNPTLLTEGKFKNSEGDDNWWISSGIVQFKTPSENQADIQDRFYCPVSYTDPYGALTKVKYYGKYFLFINETEDALNNKSVVENFNFRTLSPKKMRDINGNFSEVIIDELGLVKATAVMGKGNDADELSGISEITDNTESAEIQNFLQASDSVVLISKGKALLQHATSRFIYDLNNYTTSGKPAAVASITREKHTKEAVDSPVQIAFEYSNGTGETVMKKTQAEAGVAKKVIINPDHSISINSIDTSLLNPKQLRWIGNGRSIKNNKGKVVKQYEPYFSLSWQYESYKELVETGVTPLMFYDALGRLIESKMPDGTLSRVEFDSWRQKVYDANDTILESSWYQNRINGLIDAELIAEEKDPIKEKKAAEKAAKHANTPNVIHFDTLGRPVLSLAHYKNGITDGDEFHRTKILLDVEGNLRSVFDAREISENSNLGNLVIINKYDMLGNLVYHKSMDSGQRWLFQNILGNPLRTWDEREHEFQYFYDDFHRPVINKVIGGDGPVPLDHIFEKIIYGESLLTGTRTDLNRLNELTLQNKNVLGRVIEHYDTAGLVDTSSYNFKGEPVATIRKIAKNYKETVNWIAGNLINDLELGPGFTFVTQTDALGRISQQIAPDGSIITPSYNATGLLDGESILHSGAASPTEYIKSITYNEKGKREKIILGNGVTTHFYYDTKNFRLTKLESKRQNGGMLQSLFYTFDAIGNITAIEDKAIPISFFANTIIEPLSEYTYDALYRLVEAKGRENSDALNFGACDNWNDIPFMHSVSSGDPLAVRKYTQNYKYDAVGNIKEMKHVAANGNWTRSYEYETANNRIKSTQVGDNGNSANYTKYKHHVKHGFLEELPHLEKISWNFKEEVVLTTRQHCTADKIPVITYYQYDANGQRIRKITENQASAGGTATKKEERIYIAGYELYKKYTGTKAGLERESLSLLDDGHRFVMIETRNDIDDNTEKQLVRYQLHNHLGSSALELDGTSAAKLISYEEYHPFGTTAYQATNKAIRSAAKRYRFTGMERDDETGLEYHSARYYLPWLGRWLNCDPIGIGDGVNVYAYCKGNPLMATDPTGNQSDERPTSSFGLTLNFDGSARVGPFINLPQWSGSSTSSPITCSGIHPTLGVYMQLGIGSECGASGGSSVSPLVLSPPPSSISPSSAAPTPAVTPAPEAAPSDDGSVGEPGFWESLIPVWGSGRESVNHFQHGNYGRGIFWAGMAVADVFLVKSLIMGGGRLLFRTGATLLTRETSTVAARATVTGLERAPSLSIEVADRLVAESTDAAWRSSGWGSGAEVANLGEWWVKRTGPGNAFVRNFGAMGIEAQEQGLARLGDMGVEFFMRDGMLFTRSAGEAPRAFSFVFANGWGRGSLRLGTIFNDIRPRNMGVGGLIFDPALPPLLHSLLWGTTYGIPRTLASEAAPLMRP